MLKYKKSITNNCFVDYFFLDNVIKKYKSSFLAPMAANILLGWCSAQKIWRTAGGKWL